MTRLSYTGSELMLRRRHLRPLTLTAAVLAAACATGRWEGTRVAADGVWFQVRRADARMVAVAGDFNGWSTTSHLMTRSGDEWSTRIVLPRGEHVFMYIVDGTTWIAPPNAEDRLPDGFGGWNGRVVVP
jgi:hypothetical protein